MPYVNGENMVPFLRTYTLKEAAEVVKCSYETIRRAVRRGDIVAKKTGKSYAITHENLVKYLNS